MTTDNTASKRRAIERRNTVFRVLSAEPRRQLVLSLMDAPPHRELSLPEAANPPALLREPEALYSELLHSHLPVLEDAGLVEWDRDPLCAKRGPNFDEAAGVMAALRASADDLPQTLIEGCHRLEEHRQRRSQ